MKIKIGIGLSLMACLGLSIGLFFQFQAYRTLQEEVRELNIQRDQKFADYLVVSTNIDDLKNALTPDEQVAEFKEISQRVAQLFSAYQDLQTRYAEYADERYGQVFNSEDFEKQLAELILVPDEQAWVLGNKDWTLQSTYISPLTYQNRTMFQVLMYNGKGNLAGVLTLDYDVAADQLLFRNLIPLTGYTDGFRGHGYNKSFDYRG